jgi:pyruvate carboxylase
MEIRSNKRIAHVEILRKDNSVMRAAVDGKVYELDVVRVESGMYSVIHDNVSFDVEICPGDEPGFYYLNTRNRAYDIELIDSQARYFKSRQRDHLDDHIAITAPMPGKVVRILARVGDKVAAGETVIVVSAMKMESEYKVKKDSMIKEILVREGDTVDGNQPLIVIE